VKFKWGQRHYLKVKRVPEHEGMWYVAYPHVMFHHVLTWQAPLCMVQWL
jgi:type II secretory pathway component PulM